MKTSTASGAQSIERAIAVVRTIGEAQGDGARLVDVARLVGITKSTAHRILQALVRAGWIEQGEGRGRFRLGMELHALGLAAASRNELVGLGERAVSRLAEAVGDTAYFQMRAGLDSICLARCEGTYPVRILNIDVGQRRPLGMGAGNLALLAGLPDADVERVIRANLQALRPYAAPGVELDAALLQRLVRETRRNGYSYVRDLFIPGMAAIGMQIRGIAGDPVGALSVAAITNRLEDPRRDKVVAVLEREVRAIESRSRKSARLLVPA